MRAPLLSLLALPLLVALALPAGACEHHLHGHQNSSDSAAEANQR
ncbi:MAG: hypothetical protein ACKO0M_06120 [Cyanobium sp.]